MAFALDATVGGSSANSFVSLAEAQTYMDARLNSSAWSAASPTNQSIALVEATRELSARRWIGEAVSSSQALAWPRAFARNPDAAWGTGALYFDTTVIPQRVKDATCELAFQFLNAGTTDIASLDATLNTRVKTVDVITTEYFEPNQRRQGLARFPRVMNYIRQLLDSVPGSARVIRG